jgi:outer membrane protein
MTGFKKLLATTLLAALALGSAARAADSVPVSQSAAPGPWSMRLRATYLDAANQNLKVSDKLIAEFDVGYRLNDTWSLELVLTNPQEHDVKLGGAPIGNFKHLPPTLLLQYHPACSCLGDKFRPYLGAGVNFTLIFDETLAGGALKLENYSVGPAVQAGFDWALNERWALNVDLKKILIGSDIKGAPGLDVNVDPMCYSLGLTYRF